MQKKNKILSRLCRLRRKGYSLNISTVFPHWFRWPPTWFHIQWVLINSQVHGLVSRVAEILQDQVDGRCYTFLHWFAKFHPTVDHNTPIPEVQDLQVLKMSQVGLQVGHKLRRDPTFEHRSFGIEIMLLIKSDLGYQLQEALLQRFIFSRALVKQIIWEHHVCHT